MKVNFFKRSILLLYFLLLFSSGILAQGKFVEVIGYVKNWKHEPAIGVNVYIEALQIGTATDIDGFFRMKVPVGQHKFRFSSVEHQTETKIVDVSRDQQRIDAYLQDNSQTLEAVMVFSESQDAKMRSLDVGKNTLSIDKINSLPSFMGEADVIKGLILLPGVSTVGEGSSGFNVRGGGVDQNLILQDGAIIFNPSHVFGFFSAFNPLIVSDATLYKSGIPASYGGRLSSVLTVETKEGNYNNYKAKAGVGLVSTKFAAEGPIVKDKLSFLIGTRTSYSDWMFKLAKSKDFENSNASFWDNNIKLSWLVDDKNKLSYSGYYSKDGFSFSSDTAFHWYTYNNSLTWKHLLSEANSLDVIMVNGQYGYTINDDAGFDAFEINSRIGYNSLKSQLNIEPSKGKRFVMGVEGTFYQFQPGEQIPLKSGSGIEYLKIENERSLEIGTFAEGDFTISPKFSFRAGLRYSAFANFGSGIDYLFADGQPMIIENVIDTIEYGPGEVIKWYKGFEPRFNLTYLVTSKSSIKLSYNRQRQYLHLISNTAAVTPTDFWKTSNRYIEPEIGDQFNLGYFHNFSNNSIESSVEIYYKTAKNILDFRDGSTLLMNKYIESALLSGMGEAYGMELYVNKKLGKTTGWVGYTYSRTLRKVNGEFDEDKISKGNWYSSNYDKPHDLTMALNYDPNPLVTYGLNFSYSTGRPVTVPLGYYDNGNLSNVFYYSSRNSERIPDYHRLDASVTVKSKPKPDQLWKLSWTFSIYNVYGRKNAYSVFFENQYGSLPKAYKLSVLGAAFPSLTINFEI